MALTSGALTRYQTVRDQLGLTGAKKQTLVERLINAVSSAMAREASRVFEYGTGLVETHRGYGDFRLILDRAPLVTLTSVELIDIDQSTITTFDAGTYEIENATAGIIYRPGTIVGSEFPFRGSGWPSTAQAGPGIRRGPLSASERPSLKVTFDGGWITPEQEAQAVGTRTLPFDLEEACIMSVVSLYRSRNRDRSLAAKSTEQVSTSWRGGGGETVGGLLLTESANVARQYRRPWTE